MERKLDLRLVKTPFLKSYNNLKRLKFEAVIMIILIALTTPITVWYLSSIIPPFSELTWSEIIFGLLLFSGFFGYIFYVLKYLIGHSKVKVKSQLDYKNWRRQKLQEDLKSCNDQDKAGLSSTNKLTNSREILSSPSKDITTLPQRQYLTPHVQLQKIMENHRSKSSANPGLSNV